MAARLAQPASDGLRWPDDLDAALVSRAQAGDGDAFEELVRRHADRLYAIVRRLGLSRTAAEDVTQEVFLRAWRGIAGFKGDARFSTWLYAIGVNEAKRWLWRERVRPSFGSLDEDDLARESLDQREEPRVAQAELREALERAVRALPLKYRAPLILRDIEGLSTGEAAAILGVAEAAFKSRLHRARLAVRARLADEMGAP
jgi:RNA polymerase sigma-70 factor (ECF subfamily)